MLIRPDSGLMFYKNTDQDCEDRKKFKMFTDPTLIKIHNIANYHKICNTVIYIFKKNTGGTLSNMLAKVFFSFSFWILIFCWHTATWKCYNSL